MGRKLTMCHKRGCDFEVDEPPELVEHLHAFAVRLRHATSRQVG
jgi:hypothetical protein